MTALLTTSTTPDLRWREDTLVDNVMAVLSRVWEQCRQEERQWWLLLQSCDADRVSHLPIVSHLSHPGLLEKMKV